MPTISGTTVERRDHVLMTLPLRVSWAISTMFISFGSIYGPFFSDLGINTPKDIISYWLLVLSIGYQPIVKNPEPLNPEL
jgi:hypothetical protein